MERRCILRLGITIAILSLVSIASLWGAAVAPGDLDISFGIGGKVITDFGGWDDAHALAIDSSGKIVVAGSTERVPYHGDFALARYNADGSLDATFGTDGKVTTAFTEFGEGYDTAGANALAIDSSGKIVVAGGAGKFLEYYDFALARYNADGSLDTTFGSNGTVTTDFGGKRDSARALAIDSSGKIVVAGEAPGEAQADFALARYNADGSLDTTFGINGKVTTDFGGSFDTATALAIDSSGKIVVAGYISALFGLARYNADGSLDATFGIDGKVITHFGGSNGVNSLAIDSQGRLVAAGWSADNAIALARYNIDGGLDATFGTDGKVVSSYKYYYYYGSVLAIDSSGKIVVAGAAVNKRYDFLGFHFALARFNTDGSLDTTFGSNGNVFTDFRKDGFAQAVAIDSSGKIVVAGEAHGHFALARYLAGETNPPTGSIMIKDRAEATKSRTVILNLGASDDSPGTIRMCISNEPTCTQWTAFAETKNWTLTTGDGMKTVNVWFKDVWGNVNSSPYSDTILLDTVAPTNGAMTAVPGDAQVALEWTGFADTGSGIGNYKVVFSKGSAPASCSLGKQIYEGPGTTYTHTGLTNGTLYYYRVCAVDNAGNRSTGRTAKAKPLSSH